MPRIPGNLHHLISLLCIPRFVVLRLSFLFWHRIVFHLHYRPCIRVEMLLNPLISILRYLSRPYVYNQFTYPLLALVIIFKLVEE